MEWKTFRNTLPENEKPFTLFTNYYFIAPSVKIPIKINRTKEKNIVYGDLISCK